MDVYEWSEPKKSNQIGLVTPFHPTKIGMLWFYPLTTSVFWYGYQGHLFPLPWIRRTKNAYSSARTTASSALGQYGIEFVGERAYAVGGIVSAEWTLWEEYVGRSRLTVLNFRPCSIPAHEIPILFPRWPKFSRLPTHPIPDEKKLDFSHYSNKFVEFWTHGEGDAGRCRSTLFLCTGTL